MNTKENKLFRILAVDDEQDILNSYTKILSGQNEKSETSEEVMQLANKLFTRFTKKSLVVNTMEELVNGNRNVFRLQQASG